MVEYPFRILQEHAQKPRFHEPCNHCGLCCRVDACEISKQVLNSTQTPCVALEVHDGKFYCGMVLRPEHYVTPGTNLRAVKAFVQMVVVPGSGCDMTDGVVAIGGAL